MLRAFSIRPCPQVFFIRDGIQFTDLVHCLRPNPKNNIQEAWRVLDFLSFHPESVNIVSSLPIENNIGQLTATHIVRASGGIQMHRKLL